jgi:hypothetical protein
MKLLELIAAFHNFFADRDFLWWPFSFLRPAPQESITMKHVTNMTLCFGGLSTLMFVIFAVANNVLTANFLIIILLSCFGGFFVWFSLVTKPLWNIRARNLRLRE